MRVEPNAIHLHQSDINDWLTCPESFRRKLQEEQLAKHLPEFVPIRQESDAALAGTAMHAMIEHELTREQIKRRVMPDWLMDFYQASARMFQADENTRFTMATFGGNDERLMSEFKRWAELWEPSELRGDLLYGDHDQDPLVEQFFDVPFMQFEGRTVFLAGTIDLVAFNQVFDWKTAGREYAGWEKQRWAVQPDVYTFGANKLGLVTPESERHKFEFVIFPRGRNTGIQRVPVWRSVDHWGWLAERVTPMLRDIYRDAPTLWEQPWMKNDQHALCSPKWCPWWSSCKGAHVPDEWDRQPRA